MDKPQAVAPKLVELKQEVDQKLSALASQVSENRVMRAVTEEDVRRILTDLVAHIADLDRAELKSRRRVLLAKIVLDPNTLNARIHYAIPAATGVMVASPRGFVAEITRVALPLDWLKAA